MKDLKNTLHSPEERQRVILIFNQTQNVEGCCK